MDKAEKNHIWFVIEEALGCSMLQLIVVKDNFNATVNVFLMSHSRAQSNNSF